MAATYNVLLLSSESRVHLQSRKPIQQEGSMTKGQVSRSIGIAAGLCIATWAAPLHANKQCYAPDARAQERAFSRAVTTEGGKTLWLGGQTASLPPVANFASTDNGRASCRERVAVTDGR